MRKEKNKRFLTKDCFEEEKEEEDYFEDSTEIIEIMKIQEP